MFDINEVPSINPAFRGVRFNGGQAAKNKGKAKRAAGKKKAGKALVNKAKTLNVIKRNR